MKRSLVALFFICALLGCEKPACCVNIKADVFFELKNAGGSNLLDPATAGSIKAKDIDVFVLRDGHKIAVSNSRMDAPENFSILQINGRYLLKFYVPLENENINDGKVTAYIKFNGHTEETVTAEIVKDGGNVFYSKIWVNGAIKCSGDECTEAITIVI